jgi:hypothetical protein
VEQAGFEWEESLRRAIEHRREAMADSPAVGRI